MHMLTLHIPLNEKCEPNPPCIATSSPSTQSFFPHMLMLKTQQGTSAPVWNFGALASNGGMEEKIRAPWWVTTAVALDEDSSGRDVLGIYMHLPLAGINICN